MAISIMVIQTILVGMSRWYDGVGDSKWLLQERGLCPSQKFKSGGHSEARQAGTLGGGQRGNSARESLVAKRTTTLRVGNLN